jgi:hypothetical protein
MNDFTKAQKIFIVGLATGVFIGAILSALEGGENGKLIRT